LEGRTDHVIVKGYWDVVKEIYFVILAIISKIEE